MPNRARILLLLLPLTLGSGPAGAQSVSELLDQLQTARGDELMRVIDALGRSHSQRAVQPLINLFDVPHTGMPQSRHLAIALGELGDARAVPPLYDAWIYLKFNDFGDSRFSVEIVASYQLLREAIIDALGKIGGEPAVEILRSATRDDQERVVQHACRALRRLQPRDMAGLNCLGT